MLLIDVNWFQGILIFIVATIAMLLFAAATQGWWLTKNKWWETIALLLIAFALFRPGFFMDRISPPFSNESPANLSAALADLEPGSQMRLRILGEDEVGRERSFVAPLIIGEGETAEEKLESTGLELLEQDGNIIIDGVGFDSPAEQAGLDFDQVIQEVMLPQKSLPKELIYLPVLGLIYLLWRMQSARRRREDGLNTVRDNTTNNSTESPA